MADKNWLSTFLGNDPIQDADPITNSMPDLDDVSAPGAGDGDTALSIQIEKLRDKLQAVCKLTGDSVNDPSGSLCDILDRIHADGDAGWLRLGERASAPTGVANKVILYGLDDGGVTKAYAKLSDDTQVELGAGGGGQTNTVVGSSGISNVGTNVDADLAPTYGSSANTVCEGDDARLSDSRAPNGSAGGDLTGSTYPNPTVAANAVTNAKMADMAQATVKGRAAAAGTGDPVDLTQTQLTVLINAFTATLSGAVPAPTTSTGKYLKDDATWDTPAGGGGGFDHEKVFVASMTGQETFNLVDTVASNVNTPSSYSVRVFVNGNRHQFNASPGTREFDMPSATQVRVGGLNISDDIQVDYGV